MRSFLIFITEKELAFRKEEMEGDLGSNNLFFCRFRLAGYLGRP